VLNIIASRKAQWRGATYPFLAGYMIS